MSNKWQTGEQRLSKINQELSKHGLKSVNGKLQADNIHPELTLAFIQELLNRSEQAEQQAKNEKPYKAGLLIQNARTARKQAEEIRLSMK